MKLKCSAVVENPVQRENLLECLNIIGVTPNVARDTVYAIYEGEKGDRKAEQLVSLFENYVRHEITTS